MSDGALLKAVDTSAWIEWFIDSAIGARVRAAFPPQAACVVPTIVQFELAEWLVRETDEESADRVLAYTMKCIVVPLDTRTALLAAELHRRHRLATADAIVYATARAVNAELLTCDAHFRALPDVALFAK